MPSISGSLQQKTYFLILDKDQEHPRKPFYDTVCYELTKDDIFYHELHYLDRPFFVGLVQFDKEPDKDQLIPFKFWKRNKEAKNKEDELKPIDPTSFRHFILHAKFVVVGNQLNRPMGHELEQYQVIETDSHKIQKLQMVDYLKDLQPIYDYCNSIQYKNIRNYLFCHSCKIEKKYTLIDDETRFKNQAFFVCRNCAGKEVIQAIKKQTDVTPAMKMYLRDVLNKYRDVNKVLNIFAPNFNILDHPEATLVGIKKQKISFHRPKPQTIYDFELPFPLRLNYEEQGRKELLPAQIMSIENGLLENQSELIVSATSSGKTMIGEIAGIGKILNDKILFLAKAGTQNPFDSRIQNSNNLFESGEKLQLTDEEKVYLQKLKNTRTKAKMLYIVPIVALANMRFREYQELDKYGINVALKVGVSHISRKGVAKDEFGKFATADVIIATYEAIDIMLRSGHPNLLRDIKTVVVDEIQMLSDEERGFILDGLIARLRLLLPKAQMIYLSATISDPQNLAKQLRAALVHYDDRPVPMERHMVMCMDEHAKMRNMRTLVQNEFHNRSSHGFLGQTIVFTNSRKNAERLAEFLNDNNVRAAAYHGGLDYWQRKLIEKSFEMQKIACVVTTAALAAGVDFPASQVIFFNLTMGIKWITVAEFEQMGGRAGRLKKHDLAKVYLLISPGKIYAGAQSDTEESVALRLLKGKIEPLDLAPNQDAQYAQILATIAMASPPENSDQGIAQNDLQYFHTLLYNGNFDLASAINYLIEFKYIRKVQNKSELQATKFGKAVAESFFKLEQANEIRKTLISPILEGSKAPSMLSIAQGLYEFNNVYVTNRMLSELSLKGQQQARSNNLFSNSILGAIQADHLGKKKGKIHHKLYEIIIKWTEEIFNCVCKDSPFCDCGRKNIENFILDYRLEGLSVPEIIETLRDEYEIQVFHGDLVDYLEAIIFALLSIQKIGKSLPVPPATMLRVREIPTIVVHLIGPRLNRKKQRTYQEVNEDESEENE